MFSDLPLVLPPLFCNHKKSLTKGLILTSNGIGLLGNLPAKGGRAGELQRHLREALFRQPEGVVCLAQPVLIPAAAATTTKL
jgi:hypothetical protein